MQFDVRSSRSCLGEVGRMNEDCLYKEEAGTYEVACAGLVPVVPVKGPYSSYVQCSMSRSHTAALCWLLHAVVCVQYAFDID